MLSFVSVSVLVSRVSWVVCASMSTFNVALWRQRTGLNGHDAEFLPSSRSPVLPHAKVLGWYKATFNHTECGPRIIYGGRSTRPGM